MQRMRGAAVGCGKQAFGDFEAQQRGRDPMLSRHGHDLVGKAGQRELLGREVDAHRQRHAIGGLLLP